MVVQHANTGNARRGEWPGGVQARFTGEQQGLLRIGVSFKHVLDDDLIHPVPDMLNVLGNLSSSDRASERIQDYLGGVVDDRGVEFVAVTQRLAVEQQVFRVGQQTVVVDQVVKVFRTVEKLVGLHAFRNIQGNGPKRGDDLSWSGLHDNNSRVFYRCISC